MAKQISCRDVGVDCDFQATGDTEEAVLQECVLHAKEAHGFTEIPVELAEKVRLSIKDV